MDSIERLAVYYWIGLRDDDAVRESILRFISARDDLPLAAYQLLSTPATDELIVVARYLNPSFNVHSEASEREAASILIEQSQRLLKKEISVTDYCRLVQFLDGSLVDARPMREAGYAYYPSWLGPLWNACDWCDETWTLENTPHIGAIVHKQIAAIEQWLSDTGTVTEERT